MREVLTISWRSITANKLRAFLTMLGVVIGVASVIAMISIGQGAQQSVTERIRAMGSNLLTLRAGARTRLGARVEANPLTNRDVLTLERFARFLKFISPESTGNAQIVYKNKNTAASITGSYPVWLEVNNYKVAEGRFFDSQEDRSRLRVAVLGADVKTELFPDEPALGKTIRVKKLPFTVVGVLEAKGSGGGGRTDGMIVIPFRTAQARVFGKGENVSSITMQALDEQKMDEAVAEVTQLIRKSHKLKPDQPDDFTIRNQLDLLKSLTESTATFTLLLAGIALISLLVGGIGIMNIMLVSVIERTREIGLRKAVGARERDVLAQFLLEAIVLSAAGGVLGVVLGVGMAVLIGQFSTWTTSISPVAVIVALIFALLTGLISGYYPARKAAMMNPIDALRYE